MFLVTFDFEHTYIKKWSYASGVECKSCEISNQMFLNQIILEKERRAGYDINIAKEDC